MASSRIAPMTFGGVSRAPGGLGGLTFSSSCPPVIQPNTRIIGLCGTTDVRGSFDDLFLSDDEERKEAKMLQAHPDGLASPKRDGWFLSDFYL